MLKDYRDWLESDLRALAGGSPSAHATGQASMAQRALDRLNALLAHKIVVTFDDHEANAVLTALEMLDQEKTAIDPALVELRERLKTAYEERTSTGAGTAIV